MEFTLFILSFPQAGIMKFLEHSPKVGLREEEVRHELRQTTNRSQARRTSAHAPPSMLTKGDLLCFLCQHI
jgi:hypothetical protein